MSPALASAISQFHKCEYESAARTALIIVEEVVRERTKLSLIGADLYSKAFSYRVDSSGTMVEKPLIQINDLQTEEQKNEHEGVKLLFLGMTRGIRNIVAHHNAKIHPMSSLSVITLCNMALDLIRAGSILKERTCAWRRVPVERVVPPPLGMKRKPNKRLHRVRGARSGREKA